MFQSADGNLQGINHFTLLTDAIEKVPDLAKESKGSYLCRFSTLK
jgi:hypothetical protein